MKKKWKYEAVNNQEDEDGYSFYPDSAIIYESAKGKQNINSNKKAATTDSGPANLALIEGFRNAILSPSAKR